MDSVFPFGASYATQRCHQRNNYSDKVEINNNMEIRLRMASYIGSPPDDEEFAKIRGGGRRCPYYFRLPYSG